MPELVSIQCGKSAVSYGFDAWPSDLVMRSVCGEMDLGVDLPKLVSLTTTKCSRDRGFSFCTFQNPHHVILDSRS